MSKYNLEDLLNEYIGGGRIGTLKISFKDLQDKMDELENSDKVIVRTLSGPSGDGKVNREFEVVDRDSAVAGGGKQERGFTVYDYKFGFDPGSEEHFMEEYPFSIGGNDLKLAMELIDGVEAGISEEKDDKKELPDSIKKAEQDQIEKDARKSRGDIKEEEGIGQLYVQPAVQKEIRFHLDAFEKGDIDVDDMIQAIEDIIFGRVPAPGMRENGHVDDYKEEIAEEDIDVDLVGATVAKANNKIKNAADMADFTLDVINQIAAKEAEGILTNSQMKIAIQALEKLKGEDTLKNMEEGHAMQGVEAELESGEIGNMDALTEKDEEVNEDKYGMIRHQLDKAAEKLQDGPLKGIPTDIVIDFIKTHIKDIRGASDEEIADEFENFRSVNYDYIDEDLKEHFNRFMFKKYS